MPISPFRAFAVTAVASLALASCGQPRELIVDDAVIKLSPVEANPSAMYFRIRGGEKATKLVAILSPSAIRNEIHQSKKDPKTGAMTMGRIESVDIPAKGEVLFKPGGYHVMLFGLNRVARGLQETNITFVFENGDRIFVTVPLESMAGAAKKDDMAGMKHDG